jgi:predicted nucleotidyltransferase component of viral defense system
MKDKPTNLPASVAARLRNVARAKNSGLEFILRRYAIERLLYRLSLSPFRDRFVLKGAMLFTAWPDDPFRTTQDLDLLGFGDPTVETIATTYLAICRQETAEDGLVFDTDDLIVEPIRDDQPYRGVRIRSRAFLGATRIPIQVDIGFGDAITPAATEIEFPALLDAEGPHLRAYPRETVVAEKFQAIVELGLANSRMKDFYDLLALARLFPFDGRSVAAAIRATFDRRQTPIPPELPIALGQSFSSDRQKTEQWTAFVSRTPLLVEAGSLPMTIDEIAVFVMPPTGAVLAGGDFAMKWSPGGPWKAVT